MLGSERLGDAQCVNQLVDAPGLVGECQHDGQPMRGTEGCASSSVAPTSSAPSRGTGTSGVCCCTITCTY